MQPQGDAISTSPNGGHGVDLTPALQRLADIAELPLNWDGDGALPPTGRAVAQAALLMDRVSHADSMGLGRKAAPWTSAPIADGGLQLEWTGDTSRIEVQVSPEGDLGFLIIRGEGKGAAYEEEDEVTMGDLADRILAVLRS